jgi:hypothetical protein
MLGKTHEDIKQRARLDGDTQLKGTRIRLQRLRFISSTYSKEFKSLGKQLGKIHPNDSRKIVKMYLKNKNSFTKAQYRVYLYKNKKREMCPDTTEPNYQLHHQKVGDEYQDSQQ